MDLTIYDVIRGPVISDKAYKLNKKSKKLVLKVHMHANKPMITNAIQKLFNVKVESISILIRKGKRKRIRMSNTTTTGVKEKRAVVTLKEGHKLDLFDQMEAQLATHVQKQSEK